MTRQSALDHFLLNIAFFVQEVESFLYIATFVQEEVLFVQEVSRFAKFFNSDSNICTGRSIICTGSQ